MIRSDCPCCKDVLHHCKCCWNKFHNGVADKDYVPPQYYGEPFYPEDFIKKFNEDMKKMALELGKEFKEKEQVIKPDKNRKYVEGEYPH